MLSDTRRQLLLGYLLLFPTLLFVILFIYGPMAQAVYYSFYKWDLLGSKQFVGIRNYDFLFTQDLVFKTVIWNTIVYTFFNVLATGVLAMAAALLMKADLPGIKWFRSLIFTPVVVPMAVMGLIWKMLYEPQFGAINSIIKLLGFQPQPFLYNPDLSMPAVMLVSVWKEFGLYAIILFGGLQNISKELYEAAFIDGAGKIKSFFSITLPVLRPIFFFVITMLLISSFKIFDHIWVMTEGGPGNSTSVLVTYIYVKIFNSIGLASAASVVLFALVLLITLVQYRVMGREQ
ncbi:carbohydrate ABC transporter permease [Paenibacillus sp. FSL H8-0034]|uniref:carbohydrate ABC transporter permease n=1 Tax=Paenibacillus sp. FSL H8-0034 TaxID=2954671 RepID=UPI0030F9917E